MGNRIVSEFAEQLRLSTLGSTLCSRTASLHPTFPQIGQFPGVARAFVLFDGTKNPNNIDTPCLIRKSFNVQQVVYKGQGRYVIQFSNNVFSDINYLTTGSILRNSLTGAEFFNVINTRLGGEVPTLTSVYIGTFTTNITAEPSNKTEFRNCDGGSFLFFA